MKRIILVLVFFVFCQFSWAQQELNNYKYVIVPKKFAFQKSNDSYKINSFTKYLLNKIGFITIFDDAIYPDELVSNQCLALKVNLLKKPSFLTTKIRVAFTNCQNKTVYVSEYATSKLKDYNKIYREVIRRVFNTFDDFQYNYTPKKEVAIKKVPLKIKTSKPVVVIKEAKNVQIAQKKAKIVKQEFSLVGLYKNDKTDYEIAAFQNYYIFSKRIKKGNSFQSKPLGFIYKTSKKGSYLVKTSDTFTGYLLEKGNFVIDIIDKNGAVKSVIYTKSDN